MYHKKNCSHNVINVLQNTEKKNKILIIPILFNTNSMKIIFRFADMQANLYVTLCTKVVQDCTDTHNKRLQK